MRLPRSAAFAVILPLTLALACPALALCPACNATVRLDGGLAECFAERADAAVKQLSGSNKPFLIVDLSDCTSRGGLPTGGGATVPLDTKFAADAPGLKCLAAQIAAADDATLEPNHLFDLTKDCPAQ